MWKQNHFHNSKCSYIPFLRKLDSIRKALRCMEQWYIQGEQLPLLWTGLQQCGSKLCLTYTSKEATCMIQVTAWVHDYIIHFGMFSQVYSSQRRRLKEYRLQEKLLQGNLAYYTFKVCKTLTQPCMCNVPHWLSRPSASAPPKDDVASHWVVDLV